MPHASQQREFAGQQRERKSARQQRKWSGFPSRPGFAGRGHDAITSDEIQISSRQIS